MQYTQCYAWTPSRLQLWNLSGAKALLQSFSSRGTLRESHYGGEGMYGLAELRTMTFD